MILVRTHQPALAKPKLKMPVLNFSQFKRRKENTNEHQ